ncbi:metabotropic glutamate receptor 2-like [Achroia grisella]|uniref:metabotropic glutamate receptor 2-like n=1 Tax=Achroia grisella TaxID=688607 RepID=UPI0027D2CE5A|nr:metabotropic glutamate receptor 2-like [Achroia grisella]
MVRVVALWALLVHVRPQPSPAAGGGRALLHTHVRWEADDHDDRLAGRFLRTIVYDQRADFANISQMFDGDLKLLSRVDYVVDYENYISRKYSRYKRETHSLIAPFDISKMFKKKKYKNKTDNMSQPSASSLQASMAGRPDDAEQAADAARSTYPNNKRDTGRTAPDTLATQQTYTTRHNHIYNSSAQSSKPIPPLRLKITEEEGGGDVNSAGGGGSGRREVRLPYKKKPTENETLWPVKHAAVVEGDIILGGLMMVHARSEGATCGRVMSQGGVQALEAMLFALDEAARARLPPPGVRLGAHVLDDCDNDTYGLEMALDFIKGSISNIDDAEYACNATAVRKVISGVVGAASSVTSVQVANLLRLFKIPQVSFFSTSPELSNKARFEYFTRTIPSDQHQVRAMVEIVKKLGWKYVSIIYEESNYGIKAFEELETLLARNDICIAVKERLVKDSGEADENAYDAIVSRLLSRPRARGVIVFGSDQEVAGVMAAAGRLRATDTFGWVGSDGWSARALVSEGNEAAVEGTISVQPQANPVRGFRDYFLNLTVQNNPRNPWFVEFWEDHFRCRYPGSARTPYNGQYSRACSGRERLTADNTEFEAQLQFVADAVLAFVHAIRDMHDDLCGGKPGLCEAMRPASGAALLRYLRKVRFIGLSGDEFHFDSNGDGPVRYNILHFKQVSPGVYRWLKVGRYLDGELELNMDDIQFKWEERRPPESVCSAECELGQAKQYVEGESCCWHCFNCTQYEIRSPVSETACAECPLGTLPDAARTSCARVPELYLRPDHPAAIGAMAFSTLGLLLTTFVLSVWAAHGDTPVVRASGRELSFVLLTGIMMCYLITFALVLRPTDFLCSLQRFGTGFCFTVVYAALLTKTNRIARIFDASKHSARRPSLISPKSQLVICSILVSIQVVVVVVWQVVSPARAIHHHPSREDNMLVCDSYVDASYTIAFFYPVVLIVVCTVYAVLTRKIPEAFNESKHIGFTMYTTCVIWLAFVPLYFGTASHVPLRVTSMAVTISLSASVTLACLFAPKLYIIIVRPERNVRATLMPPRWRAGGAGCAGGAARAGGAAGAAGGAVCAAFVGAAPLPRAADLTPSTDLSTLNDTEKNGSLDRQVQTDETFLYPRLKLISSDRHNCDIEENGLCLDPRRLLELRSIGGGAVPAYHVDGAAGVVGAVGAVGALGALGATAGDAVDSATRVDFGGLTGSDRGQLLFAVPAPGEALEQPVEALASVLPAQLRLGVSLLAPI